MKNDQFKKTESGQQISVDKPFSTIRPDKDNPPPRKK